MVAQTGKDIDILEIIFKNYFVPGLRIEHVCMLEVSLQTPETETSRASSADTGTSNKSVSRRDSPSPSSRTSVTRRTQ